MSYLICTECWGYYELQPGEKPEDFNDKCECGGNLVYSESLENIEEEFNDSKTTKCPNCGTENPDYANYCQECREKIGFHTLAHRK